MRRLREDVHIHAPPSEVYGRLADCPTHREWLPPAFADLEAREGELAFALSLPLRTERARLSLATEEPPYLLEYTARNGTGGPTPRSIESLTWVVSPEGAREVHLTVEAGYHPAGGPLGWLLEMTMHAPVRRQALRDALWRLKLLIEGRYIEARR
jgi:hypothetical protein